MLVSTNMIDAIGIQKRISEDMSGANFTYGREDTPELDSFYSTVLQRTRSKKDGSLTDYVDELYTPIGFIGIKVL